MKIAIVAHLMEFPGNYPAERRVEMLARGLVERGHCVTVVIPRKLTPGVMEKNVLGVQVRWFYDASKKNNVTGRIKARWKAWRWLNAGFAQGDFDSVLLYSVGIEGVLIALSARQHQCNVCTLYGDLRYHPLSKTMRDRVRLLLLEIADFILPKLSHINMGDTRYLSSRLQRIAPNTQTIIIPPLVDPASFHLDREGRTELRRIWSLDDHIVIGYFGNFWIVQGVANLLKAIRILVDREKNIKLLIGGRANPALDCDDVPSLIAELGLEGYVVFPGFITDVVAAISACDIVTVPRIHHPANEAGSPTKLGEYMAVGKPVVAAAIGDIPLYVKDGVDALLVEPGDVEALAIALERLVDDAQLRQSLAMATIETVERVFHYKNAASRIEEALDGRS